MLIFVHHAKRGAQENIGLSHLEELVVRRNDGVRESAPERFLHFHPDFNGECLRCSSRGHLLKPVAGRVCMNV